MPTIFITNGVSSFPDPGDWNPSANTVECVGAGGYGAGTAVVPDLIRERDGVEPLAIYSGQGGGGGAYAKGTNINPSSWPVRTSVSQYGGFSGNTTNYYLTAFGGNSNYDTNAYVYAADGTGGDGMNFYGRAGTAVKPTGFAGGNGAQQYGTTVPGAGGGGAGGPRGVGSDGALGSSGGAGGAGDGGNVAGAAQAANGNKSTWWDSTHGTGGGAGGGTTSLSGGAGGTYGGGGGGKAIGSTGTNGAGSPGLIVIIYTPLVPVPAQTFVVV